MIKFIATWKNTSLFEPFPYGGFRIGFDNEGNEVYLGRTQWRENLVVARLTPKKSSIRSAFRDREADFGGYEFEVLMASSYMCNQNYYPINHEILCWNRPGISNVPHRISSVFPVNSMHFNPKPKAQETLQMNAIPSTSKASFSTPQKSSENSNNTDMCIICLITPRDSAFSPCGHLSCCRKCADTVNRNSKRCPICRKMIDFVLKIYKV